MAERLRSGVIGSIVPSSAWIASFFRSPSGDGLQEQINRLALENERLRSQVAFLTDFDRYQEMLTEQLDDLSDWVDHAGYEHRVKALSQLIELELEAVPARVIFRSPGSWSHSCWIDIGEDCNRRCGREVIAKDSPVVVGNSLVGMIDYVGSRQSRVRLISDPLLHPAVRVIRGAWQDGELLTHLQAVQEALVVRQDLGLTSEECHAISEKLEHLRQGLDPRSEGFFLAKGVLAGASGSRYRGIGPLLMGEGFNYDYGDVEGGPHDLRMGWTALGCPSVPLVRAGDLLVTSGLDGMLPLGLRVGTVHEVHKLQEGACSYSLTAVPTAGDLNRIRHVLVLPRLKADALNAP